VAIVLSFVVLGSCVVGLTGLVRGRVGWARIPNRKISAAVSGISVLLFLVIAVVSSPARPTRAVAVGSATASPSTPSPMALPHPVSTAPRTGLPPTAVSVPPRSAAPTQTSTMMVPVPSRGAAQGASPSPVPPPVPTAPEPPQASQPPPSAPVRVSAAPAQDEAKTSPRTLAVLSCPESIRSFARVWPPRTLPRLSGYL